MKFDYEYRLKADYIIIYICGYTRVSGLEPLNIDLKSTVLPIILYSWIYISYKPGISHPIRLELIYTVP
jgi:hypothetical protein